MRRLFVAVWPPDEVLDRVAELPRPAVEGLRWTAREQWHVTLRFLGPVADLGPVGAALTGLDAGRGPITAHLGPAVTRLGRRILQVPAVGVDAVAEAVVGATAHLGTRPDDRPFRGHLTLARLAKEARVDLRALTGAPIQTEWEVGSVCLVESRLSPAGARYEVLERFGLRTSR
ncbi:MAG: 2'-5' RNA ligase family protein [Acidimicrobiales bacterium]